MNEERNRRIITILSIFTIIFTLMGGSLAYWNWSSEVRTGVAFTIDKDFSCSADGGGHITPSNISLEPSTCDNPNTSIKRKIVVTPDIKKSGLEISLDMWLNVNSLGTGLSNSINLKYVLTTSESSCEEGVISEGNFSSKASGDRVMLLEKNYTVDAGETYYLYIWLDKEETSMDTMNQSFDFSLGGNCSNYVGEPEAPVLDPVMIPVTIANDGKVTTVSKDDPEWYDYSNKEWANIVLVNEEATEGVTNSHERSYYQNNIGEEVTEEDIVAYYVWIPRYKYKIPTNKSCYEIENPTPETHPECYNSNSYYELLVSEEEAQQAVVDYFSDSYCNYDPENCDCDVIDEGEGEMFEECTWRDVPWSLANLLAGGYECSYVSGCESKYYISDILPSKYYTKIISYTLKPDRLLAGNPTSIDIVFESKDEDMILGNATTQYRSHPAFWNDSDSDNVLENGEMLSGFWMAKFEPSIYSTITECVDGGDDDGDGIWDWCAMDGYIHFASFLPMKDSDSSVIESAGIPETISFDFGLNNITVKTHQINNDEWGAVAYLSHSIYGINNEVRINNTKITGCGATTNNASLADNCDNGIKYGSGVTSYPQSTTGNITGVFDMSGGKGEIVSLKGDYVYRELDDYPYWEVAGIKCGESICFGSAVTEVSGWYDDVNSYNASIDFAPEDASTYLLLLRGGAANSGEKAGLFARELISVLYDSTLYVARETIIVK